VNETDGEIEIVRVLVVAVIRESDPYILGAVTHVYSVPSVT
jgi:hypothetical protein